MIVTVTFNPAIDKTAEVDTLVTGGLNRLKNVMLDAGGKGINVSKTIQALGGTSICTGFLAGSSGDYIKDCLNETGITCDFVRVEGNTRTNLKVLDSEMMLTELNEAGPTIKEKDILLLTNNILHYCDEDTIVVLSGNVSIGVEDTIYEQLINKIKAHHALVILDADGALFHHGIKAGPQVIKPNRYELSVYFQCEEDMNDETVIMLAKQLLNEDTVLVVVSMGKDGSLFIQKDAVYKVAAIPIQAHSSVGAGDAMVAAIAYALAQHLSMEEMMKLAAATSAGAVITQGTQPADYESVEAFMKQVKLTKVE